MDWQEMGKLLDELLYNTMTIRAQQVQFLAESDRKAEDKVRFRILADAAWKRYNAIHKQFTEAMRQTEAAQEK